MQNPTASHFDPTPLVASATQQFTKMQAKMKGMEPMLKALTAATEAINQDPHALLQRQLQLHQSHLALGANFLETMLGRTPTPVGVAEKDDRRFTNPAWDNAFSDLLKQSYLLTSQWLLGTVASARGMDAPTQAQAMFYTRLLTESMSPSNTLLTNPEALSTALATQGQSLIDGAQNLMADIQSGKISMTDYAAFKVGENLATTPGQVVFRNHLIELIQYAPTTPTVHATPLLICPPWINRFYILDLKPENSFVKFAVDQGFTTFMISWKNPDASYRNVGFEDYATEGFIAAMEAVLAITGAKQTHTIGYCIGGTLVAATCAALNAKAGKEGDKRIASTTFFTSLVDFKNAGEVSVFIDEPQLAALEEQMQRDGFLDGRSMAGTFSALRSSDLIWNYVINNYLMGKQPMAFDILYWNDDSTRMPCAMHTWYLRQLYLHNNLVKKGKLSLLGQPIDITNLPQPLYMVTGANDHITPWESCYGAFANMVSTTKRFVLAKAGHVAGVVCPPTPAGKPVKRSFQVSDSTPQGAQNWLAQSTTAADSWWPDWSQWLGSRSGTQVKAPAQLGNAAFKPLHPAPGTYVLEK